MFRIIGWGFVSFVIFGYVIACLQKSSMAGYLPIIVPLFLYVLYKVLKAFLDYNAEKEQKSVMEEERVQSSERLRYNRSEARPVNKPAAVTRNPLPVYSDDPERNDRLLRAAGLKNSTGNSVSDSPVPDQPIPQENAGGSQIRERWD